MTDKRIEKEQTAKECIERIKKEYRKTREWANCHQITHPMIDLDMAGYLLTHITKLEGLLKEAREIFERIDDAPNDHLLDATYGISEWLAKLKEVEG